MNYKLILFAALFLLTPCSMMSQRDDMMYYPDGEDFVTVNGSNRYTRALYGGHDIFRLETSDRPVFATYNKKNNQNISFTIVSEGKELKLDETSYCESRYRGGRRDYLLKDSSWGKATMTVAVMAYTDHEGALWKFSCEGFSSPVTIRAAISEIANSKFKRMGDIGKFFKEGSFDAPKNPQNLRAKDFSLNNDITYVSLDSATLSVGDYATDFIRLEKERADLAGTIRFTTPDPYINPLGSALVMAADGAWDGETWLHGAIGWRMQLPGWRAGYLGDFLGMKDRAVTHFDAYAESQVTDIEPAIPHPSQDPEHGLSRGIYKWGTQMYSNGYICCKPHDSHRFSHYDMNLNYIDELLWHFQFDADTAYMKKMWPVLKLHLEWEKRNWDPDNDHLYDAYCCIWASDALYYNGGAGTHSSAYNYRANLLAARIAEIIGEDPTPYQNEATEILKAMNDRLWVADEGHWAEYQDYMGLKRLHKNAAVWSIYTPIDCESFSGDQAYQAMKWVDKAIPRIPIAINGKDSEFRTISTSDWQPYEWSINNVAMGEVMHTALAYFQAGRPNTGYNLLKGNIIDFMYMGKSPANFGQISKYDAVLGESYRDFSDVTGIASRALIQGLFGIQPEALYGRCIIRPGFPNNWDSCKIETPYIIYNYKRENGQDHYTITQNFTRPLQIIIRQNTGEGKYKEWFGSTDKIQTISFPSANFNEEIPMGKTVKIKDIQDTDKIKYKKSKVVDLSQFFNAKVDDIFKNKYVAPRPPFTSLEIPSQGIGDWCSTKKTADIQCDKPVVYTSLWDNYPDSVRIPLKGKAANARLTMAGSTNAMQAHIANGIVKITYQDGTSTTLELVNPDNWCPIERDYYHDGMAYRTEHRPLRLHFATGKISRNLSKDLGMEGPSNAIPGGAATILDIPLDNKKKLKDITVRTLSNDVIIGLIKLELQR